jgi:trimeric autotransporter adhesin
MSTTPTITITPELQKAIDAAASPMDITSLIRAEVERQTGAAEAQAAADAKAAADKAAAEKAAADKAAADAVAIPPKKLVKVENINGRDFEFEADSQTELDAMIVNAYRVANGLAQTTDAVTETPEQTAAREAAEKAAADAEAARKAELQLKMQRGEITMKEYIEQSDAVGEYLRNQGLSVDALKKTVEATENDKYQQSWADATEVFRTGVGANWPGGDKNVELMGMEILRLGLTDADDKVAALNQAYTELQRRGMIYKDAPAQAQAAPATEPPKTETTPTKTYSESDIQKLVAEAVQKAVAAQVPTKTAPQASSLFGTSYGTTSSAAGTTEAAVKKDIDIPANARPEEILEAWKTAQLSGGKDPNAAFMESFRGKR